MPYFTIVEYPFGYDLSPVEIMEIEDPRNPGTVLYDVYQDNETLTYEQTIDDALEMANRHILATI